MKSYYNLIKYEFCEKCDWHPVYGGWDKPVEMSENQFIQYSKHYGHEWWNWNFFDPHIPTEEEMIDELEFIHGSLFHKDLRGNIHLRFNQKSIHLIEPVTRVAKNKTKKGKRTIVYQYHLPVGNPIDRRIVRQKCLEAHRQIMKGMSVSVALKTYHIKWNSLIKYSDYVPKRNVEVNRKVSEIRQKLLKEPKLNVSNELKEQRISPSTFWKKTGGKKSVLEILDHDVTHTLNLTIVS